MRINRKLETNHCIRILPGLILALALMVPGALQADPPAELDTGKLADIRDYISMDRHPDHERNLRVINKIAGNRSHEYLLAIAGDSGLSERIRIRAFSLLQYYPDKDTVIDFLEASITDGSMRTNLRRWAVLSYDRGFSKSRPVRVNQFLRQQAQNSGGDLKRTIQRCLED